MMMTCLIGVAGLILCTELSSSAAAGIGTPKPNTDTANASAQAVALACHFLVLLGPMVSSRVKSNFTGPTEVQPVMVTRALIPRLNSAKILVSCIFGTLENFDG